MSGAGGLGVGTSLDVEDIEPVALVVPLTEDRITQLMEAANPSPR